MNSYENFSSLPPDEERQFAVYEERTQVAEKYATKMGLIVGGALAAIVLLFALVIPPEESDVEAAAGGGAESAEGTDELGAE